ncbi:unnamed protein product [Ilex paraguariensis]|uniref:Uncharacterized protein n=1 Tax=Ilex paraguariensis TaxID=185542 RepID=A0ABC8QW89_9AQUA
MKKNFPSHPSMRVHHSHVQQVFRGGALESAESLGPRRTILTQVKAMRISLLGSNFMMFSTYLVSWYAGVPDLDSLELMRVELMTQAEPMSFFELMTLDNLFLFSAAAAEQDFPFFPEPDSFSSESDKSEDIGVPSKRRKRDGSSSPTSDSGLGEVLFSITGQKLMDLLSSVEKERDELKEENLRLKEGSLSWRDD